MTQQLWTAATPGAVAACSKREATAADAAGRTAEQSTAASAAKLTALSAAEAAAELAKEAPQERLEHPLDGPAEGAAAATQQQPPEVRQSSKHLDEAVAAAGNFGPGDAAFSEAAMSLAAYQEGHRQRYAERLLKETLEAAERRRMQQEQRGVQLARRLEQEEKDRYQMDLASRSERDRQLLVALAPTVAAADAAAGDPTASSVETSTFSFTQLVQSEGGAEETVRPPMRTNYAERLLYDVPGAWSVTGSSTQQRLLAEDGPPTPRSGSTVQSLRFYFVELPCLRESGGESNPARNGRLCGWPLRQVLPGCALLFIMSLPLAVIVYELVSL